MRWRIAGIFLTTEEAEMTEVTEVSGVWCLGCIESLQRERLACQT